MERPLTAAMATQMTGSPVVPVLLVKMEFSSGDLNVWSGYGDIAFGGDTYTGVGDLGSVSPITETQEVAATGASFGMSGIPASMIATALAEDYQERPARMWLGALDLTIDPPPLVADPYQIFAGRMDVMTIAEDAETATISVSVENRLIDLEVAKQRRYTAEDQKNEFPGDTGLDQVTALQDAEITWGKG